MDVKKVKKGKQRHFINKVVKELDEEPITGENLFGEPMDLFEVGNNRTLFSWGT